MSRNKNTQQVHPQNDVETASMEEESNSKELHHKRSMRRLCCVTVIVLLLTIVVLVFTTTIFHVHSAKFRIRSITIDELSVISSSNAIDMKFEAEIGIKNTNFADFEFEKTSVGFFYRGTRVALVDGDAMVEEGKVKARSTKKVQITAEMGTANSILVDDIKSGALTLTGNGKLSGTVHLMKLIKRKRSFEMNCTININLNKKVVQDINCK